MVGGDFVARRNEARPLLDVVDRLSHLHSNHGDLMRAPRCAIRFTLSVANRGPACCRAGRLSRPT
jgi:hypothetical protein